MNAINRIGQKILCVKSCDVSNPETGKTWSYDHWPKEGARYTVRGFASSRTATGASPGLLLHEINPLWSSAEKITEVGWPIHNFRPLLDVSDFATSDESELA